MPDELRIEPMTELHIQPVACYCCSNCGAWTAFTDKDPEWFVCGNCKRSVVPHGDG